MGIKAKSSDPWKAEWCDFIFNRECSSPWKDDGFQAIGKNKRYLEGYLAAQRNGVKLATESV